MLSRRCVERQAESGHLLKLEGVGSESGAPLSPPEDHFRRLRQRASAPPVVAVAARSLPVLGMVETLPTLLLEVGVVRGELPYLKSHDESVRMQDSAAGGTVDPTGRPGTHLRTEGT
jgi:hypothetical protein